MTIALTHSHLRCLLTVRVACCYLLPGGAEDRRLWAGAPVEQGGGPRVHEPRHHPVVSAVSLATTSLE